MKIEFNPSQVPQAELAQPTLRQASPSAASDSTSFSASSTAAASLQEQVASSPMVRDGQVARAAQLVSDPNFPPGYYEERIATLLALHMKMF